MIVLNFGTKFLLRWGECKTREIPISEKKKGHNRNFDYKIVISVKNPELIL